MLPASISSLVRTILVRTALVDAIRYTLDTNSSEWVRIQESDFRRGQSRFSIQLKFEAITSRQARVFVEHLTHEVTAGKAGRHSVLYITLTAELTDHVARGTRYIRTELRSGKSGTGPSVEREVRAYLSATYLRPLRDAEAELTASRWIASIAGAPFLEVAQREQ